MTDARDGGEAFLVYEKRTVSNKSTHRNLFSAILCILYICIFCILYILYICILSRNTLPFEFFLVEHCIQKVPFFFNPEQRKWHPDPTFQ